MKIISPSFEILTPLDGKTILKHIELCGRVCYKSEDKITDTSAAAFVAGIIKRGHEAVLEHFNISVKFICDRGVSHELVRHRLASYCQESTGYCNYYKEGFGGEITVIRRRFWWRAPRPLPAGEGPVKRLSGPISPCWSGAVLLKRPALCCPTASKRRW